MDKMDELYEIAEAEGITIDEIDLSNIQAVIVRTEEGCHIGLDRETVSVPHLKKEMLAHELGHCVRDAVYEHNSIYPKGKLEHQADAWAIKKLIPEAELKKALKNSGIDCTEYDIAERFGVSIDFLHKAVEYYKNASPMK